jgi:hypothetical protein
LIRSFRDRLLTREGLAALFVALLPLVYFLPAMYGGIVLCPDDGLTQNLPMRAVAANMLGDGHFPLWSPYIFGGMPLFASAQAGVLFPLNWFFLFFPPGAAMNLAVLSAYSAAGLGAFLYARRIDGSVLGALVTGLVWQCCGFMVAQIGHTNVIQLAAVLPWLLWSIDGYGMTGLRRRGALVAIFVALLTFAGHPQTLVYSLLLCAAYTCVRGLPQTDPPTRRFYWHALALLVVGLALAAVQIWPTLELLRHSVRNEATYEFFSSFSLPPVFLLTFLAPFVVGGGDGILFRAPYTSVAFYGEYIGYVGLIPFALALLASVLRRDRLTIFWSCVAVIALALALGRHWPFDLYRLIYQVPILNLFRVPARHLMEVDFALAVLAGQAVTTLARAERRARSIVLVSSVALVLFVLTLATVTIWRPETFRLARIAPVSLLRAPELFMPVLFAGLSAWALIHFARGKRFAGVFLVAVILCDLGLWGQSTGWRLRSPRPHHALFQKPDAVKMLQEREGNSLGKYRVLTLDEPFPAGHTSGAAPENPAGFEFALQPDIYGMHRIENAAGYEGFGLARQSRLAGDMKIWGAFPDPRRTLFASRELDILNVRYLLSKPPRAKVPIPDFLPATTKVGDLAFAGHDLGLPFLQGGTRLEFDTPPLEATRIAVVTSLAFSTGMSDGTTVATVTLRGRDGQSSRFDLRAGIDSSEWAYDRPSLKPTLRHSRAPIAWSSEIEEGQENYASHTYAASFVLPQKMTITGGSIEVSRFADTPNFALSLLRMSFIDEPAARTIPLRREWLSSEVPGANNAAQLPSRWIALPRVGNVVVHQNTQVLPRVWLAAQALAVPDETKLSIIRTGLLPDGSPWDPRRTALLDRTPALTLPEAAAPGQMAEIVRYQPNRVDIATLSSTSSLLVLADNHYPGWSATVDDQRASLLRVNYNLRGVALDPGQHVVRFSYRPKSVQKGLLISFLAALFLVVWCNWGRKRGEPVAS